MYDIIVVGGGPAGMTAALYGLRNGKTVLIIEKAGFGGQITYSPKVENYPGTKQISGNELADAFLDQIIDQGAELEFTCVTGIKVNGDIKRVLTEDGGEFEAKAVIIATGVKHRMLGVEGENELIGNGISFCAVCDGNFYKGETVAVAGGGNSALQEAILLADTCKEVIVIQDLDEFTGEKRLQNILFSKPNVKTITGTKISNFILKDGAFSGIMVKKGSSDEETEIRCSGLFVAVGLVPENGAFGDIAKLNDYGYFDSTESCETETPGIYCAGDCRSKTVRQLTTAVSDGAVAALAACRYIDAM